MLLATLEKVKVLLRPVVIQRMLALTLAVVEAEVLAILADITNRLSFAPKRRFYYWQIMALLLLVPVKEDQAS